jgi:hypothetical protein
MRHSPQGDELCGMGVVSPPKSANEAGAAKPRLNAGNPTLKSEVAHRKIYRLGIVILVGLVSFSEYMVYECIRELREFSGLHRS